MNSIVMQSRRGPDSKLHVEVSVSEPNTDFDVEGAVRAKPGNLLLPPNYFDLIGSIDDETFVRPAQSNIFVKYKA